MSDSPSPRLSVVVPFHNAARTLPRLLTSLALQTHADPGVELIAVDDGSDDDGARLFDSATWKVIRLPGSGGPAAARNEGVRASGGEVILFLDADVVVGPDLLEHVSRRFADDPSVIALSGIYDINPANEGFFPNYKALRCHDWFRGKTRFGSFETACAAIRRTAFLAAGGFDESFRDAEVEDYEFGYRLAGSGGIPIDHEMRVRHHFPTFRKNAAKFFRRAYLWAKLARPARFDTVATTRPEAAAAVASCLTLFVIVAGLITRTEWCGYLGLALLTAHLAFRRSFYLLSHEEYGPRFTIAAIAVSMANDMIVVPAALAGTARRYLGNIRLMK
jgi:glycosyltransferase involved in cell wall biosynthesis